MADVESETFIYQSYVESYIRLQTMKLNKTDREKIRNLFGGRCAYCGEALGQRWHADHIAPVFRITKYESVKKPNGHYTLKTVNTGLLEKPDRDMLDNIYPSCVPCNLHKGAHTIESWRRSLQKKTEELMRDSSAYRHAKRFGLVKETGINVVFYFEKFAEN